MDATNAVERRQGVLDYLAGSEQDEIGEKDPGRRHQPARSASTCWWTPDRRRLGEELPGKGRGALAHQRRRGLPGRPVGIQPAGAAARRAQLAERDKPAIVGFDENFQTLEGIQTGEIIGTVVQNPYKFGYESIKILAGLAKGDDSVLKNRTDIDDAEPHLHPAPRHPEKPWQQDLRRDHRDRRVAVFHPEMKKLRESD